MNTQAFRVWLCSKFGHKFYVGSSGHYVGMPQNRCWRCGIKENTKSNEKLPLYETPLGGLLD